MVTLNSQQQASSILITGATSGIGKAVALLAASRGYQVIACGRSTCKLAELAEHENIQTCQFDVTDETATRQVLGSIRADIVVLNAGTCEYVDLNHFDPALFRRVFEANFFGIVNCVAALLPAAQSGQKWVFVDSLARLLPFTRSQAYGASKAALHYFCKSLETDLRDKGVCVQSVSPGFVKTPLTDKNDFDMPMRISAEQAAVALLHGIERGQASIYFPLVFSLIMRLLAILPDKLKGKLCRMMRPNNKNENELT